MSTTTEFLRIGPRIARIRKSKNMSQADLAARLNTDQQVISRYEQDVVGNMALKKVLEFAEALEVEPAELIGTASVTVNADNYSPTNGGVGVGYNTGTFHVQNVTPEMLSLMDELKQSQKSAISAKDDLIERLKAENEQLRRELARNYILNEGPK